jgi:hypothetical protein
MTDWIEVTIRLPQSLLEDAARKAAAEIFCKPPYRDHKGGEGYEIIKSEIRKQINIFVGEGRIVSIIRKVIEKHMEDIAYSVTTDELRRTMKKVAKKKIPGELFDSHKA